MKQKLQVSVALMVLLLTGLGVPGATAKTLEVSTPKELKQALAAPAAGTIIELAPGEYGALSLRGLQVSEPVTLRSADPKRPAEFSEMTLLEVKGLTLENLVFDYTFKTGDKIHLRPFKVLKSEAITIRDALFDGDVARGNVGVNAGYPTAFGLGVRNTSGFTLESSEIRNFFRGSVISQTRDITVHGNTLHSIRMDGMNFAEVQNVRIEANHIHNFIRNLNSKDHADMIQFWTNRTSSPSRNITIRNNVLNSGQGHFTQSIFMRNDMVDRGLAGDEMFYRDLTIENNVIINAHLHGITVGETDNLVIRNNTVVRNARSEGKRKNRALWTPQIRVAETSTDVTIKSNITSKITGQGQQRDWRVEDNLFVQDHSRQQAGFYGLVFGADAVRDPTQPSAFVLKAGSAPARQKVGAPALLR